MKKMTKIYCAWMVLCLLLISAIASAKGKDEHIADMKKVYSFMPQNNPIVANFFLAVNASIDYSAFDKDNFSGKPGKPAFVKEPPFENTTWANHRIWFHWGYSTNVRQYAPLTELVNKNIASGKMSEQDRDLFYTKLYEEVGRRNRVLQDITANLLGYDVRDSGWSSAMRSQINAFVAIPYAVHLLGDRTTTEVSVMQSMGDIVSSVFTAIRNLAGNVESNRAKANAVISELRKVQNDPVLFLEKMQELLPNYIMSLEGGIYDIKSKVKQL